MSALRLLAQLALGMVFAGSAAAKLRAPAAFLRGVVDYDLLPRPAALVAGAVLVPLEGLLAFCLLSGWLLGAALPAAVALLAVFSAAVAINLARRRAVPCYCLGGGEGDAISPRTLVRLALLVAGALVAAAEGPPWRGPLTRWTRWTHWTWARVAGGEELVHAAMLAALLLVAGAWLLHARELWALRAPARWASPAGGGAETHLETAPMGRRADRNRADGAAHRFGNPRLTPNRR